MSILIFDPFAGISGDMTLAALLDVGLEEKWLRAFVAGLGIGDITVHIERADLVKMHLLDGRAVHLRFRRRQGAERSGSAFLDLCGCATAINDLQDVTEVPVRVLLG